MLDTAVGFECILSHNANLDLDRLFDGIDLSTFEYVVSDGAYIDGVNYTDILKKQHKRFYHELCHQGYIEHLVLQVFPIGAKISTILTYHSYMESECQIVLLFYDGIFLEVYAKNPQVLKHLLQNIQDAGAVNITLKYEGNDTRTDFYV